MDFIPESARAREGRTGGDRRRQEETGGNRRKKEEKGGKRRKQEVLEEGRVILAETSQVQLLQEVDGVLSGEAPPVLELLVEDKVSPGRLVGVVLRVDGVERPAHPEGLLLVPGVDEGVADGGGEAGAARLVGRGEGRVMEELLEEAFVVADPAEVHRGHEVVVQGPVLLQLRLGIRHLEPRVLLADACSRIASSRRIHLDRYTRGLPRP
jgi:hypothetical protein